MIAKSIESSGAPGTWLGGLAIVQIHYLKSMRGTGNRSRPAIARMNERRIGLVAITTTSAKGLSERAG